MVLKIIFVAAFNTIGGCIIGRLYLMHSVDNSCLTMLSRIYMIRKSTICRFIVKVVDNDCQLYLVPDICLLYRLIKTDVEQIRSSCRATYRRCRTEQSGGGGGLQPPPTAQSLVWNNLKN